jgi:uncharacterized protein YprB with RNaseH-like and TPR domain
MLRHTFIHIPGIGPASERRLWSAGFKSWEDYLKRGRDCTLPLGMRSNVHSCLEDSLYAVNEGNYRYFEELLPSGEVWRLYGDLRDRAAFLDIETTGLSPESSRVTVIGIYLHGDETDRFVQLVGRDITRDDILDTLSGIRTLHTYNGSRFDLPFIDRHYDTALTRTFTHRDLMYDCWNCNLYGGLKAVERQLGIPRTLKEVNGLEAVRLWYRYAESFDLEALDTLLEYNKEDVINLKVLREKLDARR